MVYVCKALPKKPNEILTANRWIHETESMSQLFRSSCFNHDWTNWLITPHPRPFPTKARVCDDLFYLRST